MRAHGLPDTAQTEGASGHQLSIICCSFFVWSPYSGLQFITYVATREGGTEGGKGVDRERERERKNKQVPYLRRD